MQHDRDFLTRSKAAFTGGKTTLANIRDCVVADTTLKPRRRGDMLSAFRQIERCSGYKLSEIPAEASAVREIYAAGHAAWNIEEKVFQNGRALVKAAVKQFRVGFVQLTRRIPPAPAWQALLDQMGKEHKRQGMFRLATYATAMNIAPEDVTSATLLGLHAALEAEEFLKDPRSIIKTTIGAWNWGAKNVPGWPGPRLSSPFEREVLMLPLASFTVKFQEDVQAWKERVTTDDPFDEEAPPTPLAEGTVRGYIDTIRTFASVMINEGMVDQRDLNCLADLFDAANFKKVLGNLYKRRGDEPKAALFNQGNKMCNIARHYCRLDDGRIDALKKLVRRVWPKGPKPKSAKVAAVLALFDDKRNVAKVLRLPQDLVKLADKEPNANRAAHHIEWALLVLVMRAGLRQGAIRQLELGDLRWTPDGRCIITVPAPKEKTRRERVIELNPQACQVVRAYIDLHRPILPGAQGPFLLPGEDRTKGRSRYAVYAGISKALNDVAGLDIPPHMLRHVMGKIVISRDPGALLSYSRVLGHTGLATTLRSYLGTEEQAAARHVDSIIERALEEMPAPTKPRRR